jgi:hypothetical protein
MKNENFHAMNIVKVYLSISFDYLRYGTSLRKYDQNFFAFFGLDFKRKFSLALSAYFFPFTFHYSFPPRKRINK